MRIALWGFHAYGSFGDDLSAGIVAEHLRRAHGAEVVAYRLCEPYASRFGITVAPNVEDLVAGSDAVVFTGGSTLESAPPPGRSGLTAHLGGHSGDSQRVLELARERDVPVLGVSIGGDGTRPAKLEPPSKEDFVRRARFISVRYEDDLPMLADRNTRAAYFPDILWQASRLHPAAHRRNERPRIGVSVYAGQLLPQRAFWVPPALYAAALRRRDVDWVFFDSANASRASFRALPPIPGVRGQRHMFSAPLADLELLASLDLVLSTHLPVGIVAMSYGVPFLSVAPDHRATRLMHAIGRPELCFRAADVLRLARLLASPRRLRELLDSSPALEDLHEQSAGHLRALDSEIPG